MIRSEMGGVNHPYGAQALSKSSCLCHLGIDGSDLGDVVVVMHAPHGIGQPLARRLALQQQPRTTYPRGEAAL